MAADIEATLYDRLKTFAGLSALISGRVYPLRLPTNAALPALTYQLISSDRAVAGGKDPGVVRARMQTTAFATTYSAARAVAEQVRMALERWRTTDVDDVYILSTIDVYEPDTQIYSRVTDVEVIYREDTP